MPARERFLMLLCSYLGLLRPGSQAWINEQALAKARALDIEVFDDPEKSAWEYARYLSGYGPRPDWLPRG